MKRYIIASGDSSDSKLVSALNEVILSTLDMGDYVSDVIEGLADLGDIELPDDYDDEYKMLKSVLKKLVAKHSSAIPNFIIYNFTEYDDILLEEISTRSPGGKQSDLYRAIELIYNRIGEFPSGDAVKSAIEEHIFNSELIEDDAAEFGYAIGNLYWKYIKSKEYGLRSNFASAIGVSAGCREAIGGKYKYAFEQTISSYYYPDLWKQYPEIPYGTGYILKFYKDGSALCADVFNIFEIPSEVDGVITWDIGNKVIYTFTFTDLDANGIDRASHEIADWYDAHVHDAIDAAANYRG